MGRFLTRDTWAGDSKRPITYNSWLYTYGNPINLSDPSGYHPGEDHSKYCYPLSGIDRIYCERIVRGISPSANVSVAEMRLYDTCGEDDCTCFSSPVIKVEKLASIPLEDSLPHSVYKGKYIEYGWWWHFLLDRTPGWWNENGKSHIYFKDVIAFALGVELSTTAIDPNFKDLPGYVAGAFANKGRREGFYYMTGSRASVFKRVNNALYASATGGLYDFGKNAARFNGINIDDTNYGIKTDMRKWGANILYNQGFNELQRQAYEWGNPTNHTPQSFLNALSIGNMGDGPTNVLYFSEPWQGRDKTPHYVDNGTTIYGIEFVVTQQQIATLCNNASCVNP